jgi:hypothetical protein
LLAIVTILAYAGYVLVLGQSIPVASRSGEPSPEPQAHVTLASHPATGPQEIAL